MTTGQQPTQGTASGVPSYLPPMPPDRTVAAVRPPAPTSVINAVRLMFLTTAFLVVSVIVTLATKSHLRHVVADRHPDYTSSHLDNVVNAAVISAVVFGVIFIAAYIALALRVRAGRNWARITTIVLAGLGILGALGGLAGSNRTTTSVLLNLLTLALNGSVIFLLARKESSDFFRSLPPS
jgi:uncharacterized membrane protein